MKRFLSLFVGIVFLPAWLAAQPTRELPGDCRSARVQDVGPHRHRPLQSDVLPAISNTQLKVRIGSFVVGSDQPAPRSVQRH
jgi:hypothetical protein